MRPPGPSVVAHRGSSAASPEHTLAAYRRAVDEGADGLECDVRLTRDQHLVCVHDRRLERTSDGRGPVSERALSDLDALDFGSWKKDLPDTADALVDERELYPDEPVHESGRRLLTFARLLEFLVDCGRPVTLYVETKHPTRYGALVEQRLVSALRRAGLTGRPGQPGPVRGPDGGPPPVVMMSFSTLAVRRVRYLAPDVPTMVLFGSVPRLYRDGSLPFGAEVAGPGLPVLRDHPRYVERAHAAGNTVYAWTIDEPADVDYALGLGVDAIATNRPAAVLARLGRGPG